MSNATDPRLSTLNRHLIAYSLVMLSAMALVLTITLMVTLLASHPADACHEDENWIATDYRDPDGIEWRGVTRKCANNNSEFWTPTDNDENDDT